MLEILKNLSCVQILEEGRKKFKPEFVNKIRATEKKKCYYLSPEKIENETVLNCK
jgi:hypothetical protein